MMDAAERKAAIERLRPWVLACAAAVHVDHWTVELKDDPADDGAAAQIRRWKGQLDLEVRLADSFFGLPADEQRRVLAHELFHGHLRPVWETWWDLDELLGKPAYALFRNHAEVAEEQVVEALARVVAPFLPLPPGEKEAIDAEQ